MNNQILNYSEQIQTRILSLPHIVTASISECPLNIPPEVDILVVHGESPSASALREMQEVLHAGERHGMVCARTTATGTWTSFPLEPSGQAFPDADTTIRVHTAMQALLPRYTVAPAAPSWPVLVRGDLLRRFGWPDRTETNPVAFSLRLSRYGYSTLVAHHVLLRSELPNEVSIEAALSGMIPQNESLAPLLRYYLNDEVHPLEAFAPLFGEKRRPKILYSFIALRPVHNGTSEYGLSLLRELQAKYADQFELTVMASPEAARFHGLYEDYPRIVAPDELRGVFDLGFSPCQILERKHLILLDRHCLRISFTLLDLIWVRCSYLHAKRPEAIKILRFAVRFADGITTISDTVGADTRSFFGSMLDYNKPIIRTIHLGIASPESPPVSVPDAPEPGYVLLVGNAYAHKAIIEAVDALVDHHRNLVVFGGPADYQPPDGVQYFPSGRISPVFVDTLYLGCSALVFPSQYEGFGLPVARVLQLSKPVILFPTEVNKEVVNHFAIYPDQAIFCSTFKDLAGGLAQALATNTPPLASRSTIVRTWADAAVETALFGDAVLHREVDGEHLEERREICRLLGMMEDAERAGETSQSDRSGIPSFVESLTPLLRRLRKAFPNAYESVANPYRRYVLGSTERRKP
jgi:glycosyltransferase involved in cell wall biosynthesis